MSHKLATAWLAKAEAKELAAKGYNSKCTTIKGMQCLLEARVLRLCAEQLQSHEDRNAQAVAEASPCTEADNRQSTTEAQSQDQAEGQVQVQGVWSYSPATGFGYRPPDSGK